MMINIKDSDIEGEYVCDSNKSVKRKSKGKKDKRKFIMLRRLLYNDIFYQ